MSNFNAMKATLQALTGHQNMIATPKALVELVGELDGGTLLSQLIYYSDKGKRRDGFFYKTYDEWYSEIFMSEYRIRKWVKVFQDAGWLETKIKKANGNPTVHYRFNFDTFSVSFLEFLKERNQRNSGNDTLKTSESLTETTTQTTTEIASEKASLAPPPETHEPKDEIVTYSEHGSPDEIIASLDGKETPQQAMREENTSLPETSDGVESNVPPAASRPAGTWLGVAKKTADFQAKHSDLRFADAIERLYTLLGRRTLSAKEKKSWDNRFSKIAANIGGDGPPPTPLQVADGITRFGEDSNNKWIYTGAMRRSGPHMQGFEGFIAPYVQMEEQKKQPTPQCAGAWG